MDNSFNFKNIDANEPTTTVSGIRLRHILLSGEAKREGAYITNADRNIDTFPTGESVLMKASEVDLDADYEIYTAGTVPVFADPLNINQKQVYHWFIAKKKPYDERDRLDWDNMRAFNVNEAKNGAVVRQRCGRKVRVVCYDMIEKSAEWIREHKGNETGKKRTEPKDEYRLIALVMDEYGSEKPMTYTLEGKRDPFDNSENEEDLVIVDKVNAIVRADVVRCKDCIHRPVVDEDDYEDGRDIEFPDNVCPCRNEDDEYYNRYPSDDFFCAKGELKK